MRLTSKSAITYDATGRRLSRGRAWRCQAPERRFRRERGAALAAALHPLSDLQSSRGGAFTRLTESNTANGHQ